MGLSTVLVERQSTKSLEDNPKSATFAMIESCEVYCLFEDLGALIKTLGDLRSL